MKFIAIPLRVVYTVYTVLLFWLLGVPTLIYFLIVSVLPLSYVKKGDLYYSWCWVYSVIFGALSGIRYKLHGKENVLTGGPYVFVSNHNAVADMFIMVYAMGGIRYRPLSKIELARVPLFGYLWKQTLILIDRKSPESRKAGVEMLEKLINQYKISPLIFPEGTRNRTDNPLKDFYDGAFRIAIETKVPVAPMVMLHTRYITPQKFMLMRPGLLECIFLSPVSTEGLTLDDVPMLKEKVYKLMEREILNHDSHD